MGIRIPTRLTKGEGRKFAFPVGFAFFLLAGLLWWRGLVLLAWGIAGLGGTLLLAGLLVPQRLGPVYRGWMAFALLLSKVTTPIFMGIVFFLVIAPTGFLLRLFGRNPVKRTADDGSFWVDRPEGPTRRSNLRRQF